jgi:hypothetical protein
MRLLRLPFRSAMTEKPRHKMAQAHEVTAITAMISTAKTEHTAKRRTSRICLGGTQSGISHQASSLVRMLRAIQPSHLIA